jgi:hypothetical protein
VGSTTWLKFTRGSVGDKGDGTGRDGVRGMSEKTRGRRGKSVEERQSSVKDKWRSDRRKVRRGAQWAVSGMQRSSAVIFMRTVQIAPLHQFVNFAVQTHHPVEHSTV